jgi:hypothetical protein
LKKLTLSMEESVIVDARRIAKRQGTSISAMFSRLVRAMARRGRTDDGLTPSVRRVSGIISAPKGKSDRALIEEALEDRLGQ